MSTLPPNPVPEATPATGAGPPDVLRRFLGRLLERCPRTQAEAETLSSLMLAESALRLLPEPDDRTRPLQVVVLGPTQAGKSTIVNLLLGTAVTEVSPLAGFTVHPRGCWVLEGEADERWLQPLFPGWQRLPAEQLSRDTLRSYALQNFERPWRLQSPDQPDIELPPCVVWDTPDFDSLAAGRYRLGVLEPAALADVYLVVLSKEKYADRSVWNLLRLLAPLNRPLVVVLNKVFPQAAGTIQAALRDLLSPLGGPWAETPIVPIPFCPELAAEDAPTHYPGELRGPLLSAVREALDGVRRNYATGIRALLRRHWEAWTAPLQAEHEALDAWGREIDAALDEFLQHYQRDYLEHPQRYDSFRRAALELLNLLEIPRLGGALTTVRGLVTLPARWLWERGRAWQRGRRGRPAHDLGTEATVLTDTLDTLLIRLEGVTAGRGHQAGPAGTLWRALHARLETESPRLRQAFERALLAHHENVTREVHAAAGELYEQLQAHPARLAALRTARAVLDAGAVLLAVKTGGLTPADAAWAPASFALSTLLVEGMAGAQMAVIRRGLQKRQLEQVRRTLVQRTLRPELRALGENIQTEGVIGIPRAELEAAAEALSRWEQEESDA